MNTSDTAVAGSEVSAGDVPVSVKRVTRIGLACTVSTGSLAAVIINGVLAPGVSALTRAVWTEPGLPSPAPGRTTSLNG